MKPEFTVEQIKEFVRNDYQSVAARMAKSALTHFEALKDNQPVVRADAFTSPSDHHTDETRKAMRLKFEDYNYKQFVRDHFRGCPGRCRLSPDEEEHLADGLYTFVQSIIDPDYQPGSFIQALRSGRLYSAYLRADTTNVQYFYIYMNFIFKEIPIHVLPPIMSII